MLYHRYVLARPVSIYTFPTLFFHFEPWWASVIITSFALSVVFLSLPLLIRWFGTIFSCKKRQSGPSRRRSVMIRPGRTLINYLPPFAPPSPFLPEFTKTKSSYNQNMCKDWQVKKNETPFSEPKMVQYIKRKTCIFIYI